MKESDLAAACARWLTRQGFDAHGEVEPRAWCGRFDVVGIRGDDVWVIETKLGLTADLLAQGRRREDFGTRVWLGVPWGKRDLSRAGSAGVLFVEGETVFVAREASALPGRRVIATRLACNEYTRGKLGGVQTFERGQTPSPYHVLIWRIRDELAGHEDGLLVGEILDIVRPLIVACGYRDAREALLRFLRKHDCFEVEWGARRRDNRWRAAKGLPVGKSQGKSLLGLASGGDLP